MRNGVDFIVILYGGANSHGARPLARGALFQQSVRQFFKHIFFAMIGYIDKSGFKFHERIQIIKKRTDIVALQRGKHFNRKQGLAVGFFNMVCDFHFCLSKFIGSAEIQVSLNGVVFFRVKFHRTTAYIFSVAGFPNTVSPAFSERITTEPAPTRALAPISTPATRVAPEPMNAPSPILTPALMLQPPPICTKFPISASAPI